jgi:hypothetical protein
VREGAVVDALGGTVAGPRAMKDPAEEPLDGGGSTHRWSRAPVRGPMIARFLRFARTWLSLQRGRERGSGENECYGFGDGAGTDFDLPGSTRNRPMGMDERRLLD